MPNLSKYCKEELPTWDEIYNEFWINKIFVYDPNDPEHQVEDPYWKRPRRKILLMLICNQLNKMMEEDDNPRLNIAERTFFMLHHGDGPITIPLNTPSIYTCKLPSTGRHSIFITNNHPRIDIDDLTEKLQLVEINMNLFDACLSIYDMISLIIIDIIHYFENGVGWKDDDGALIPTEPMSHRCQGVGVDPAL